MRAVHAISMTPAPMTAAVLVPTNGGQRSFQPSMNADGRDEVFDAAERIATRGRYGTTGVVHVGPEITQDSIQSLPWADGDGLGLDCCHLPSTRFINVQQ
jgi:hypothetical protein